MSAELIAGAAIGAAVVLLANAWLVLHISLALRCVAGSVLLFPPVFMLNSSISCADTPAFRIRVCASFGVVYMAIGFIYSVHFLTTCEWIDSDSANLYMEITRSAGDLFLLPIVFSTICPPNPPRAEEEQENGASSGHSVTIALPGGLTVTTVAAPGSVWDTVLNSKELRAAALAICLFFLAVGCTVFAAAAAAALGLVAAGTTLSFLTVGAFVSLAFCIPRFINPDLNTRRSTVILAGVLLPAALAASRLLQMSGWAELASIEYYACCLRGILWISLPQTAFVWLKRRAIEKRPE